MKSKQIFFNVILPLLLFMFTGENCGPKMVTIPSASQDNPPVITVNAIASGSSGRVEFEGQELSTPRCAPANSCRVHATIGSDLLITVHAKNPGGVQSITVEITETSLYPFKTLLKVTNTATRVGDTGPEVLSITGHNGNGSIGGNPLEYQIINANSAYRVEVTATNFNGMVNKASVSYIPLLPIVANINADNLEITKGQQTRLTWHTSSASTIKIDPFGSTESGIDKGGGFATIAPQQTTTYKITASNFIYDECTFPNKSNCKGAEIISKSVTVKVIPPPPTEASVKLSYRIGPSPIKSTSGKCTGSIQWTFTPLTLTGSSGKNTSFSISNNNYTVDEILGGDGQWYCYVNDLVGDICIGTWKVRVQTPLWATECNVQLKGGTNSIHFSEHFTSCELNDPSYPSNL